MTRRKGEKANISLMKRKKKTNQQVKREMSLDSGAIAGTLFLCAGSGQSHR
jgi:hypothetical protein